MANVLEYFVLTSAVSPILQRDEELHPFWRDDRAVRRVESIHRILEYL